MVSFYYITRYTVLYGTFFRLLIYHLSRRKLPTVTKTPRKIPPKNDPTLKLGGGAVDGAKVVKGVVDDGVVSLECVVVKFVLGVVMFATVVKLALGVVKFAGVV